MERIFNWLSSFSYTTLEIGINSIVIGLFLVLMFTLCRRFMKYGMPNIRYMTLWTILLAILIIPMFTVSYGNDFFNAPSSHSSYTPATKIQNYNPPTTQAVNSKHQITRKSPAAPAKTAGIELTPKTFTADDKTETKVASINFMKLLPILIFLGYISAALVLLYKINQSYFSIRQIKKSAKLITGYKPFDSAVKELRLKRKVRFGISPDTSIPIAAGFLNPMILLPENLMEELTDDELHIVLLHELAHLKRWDDFSKLGQKCIESLWFFHPVIKWIVNQIDLEREIAVDDLVIKKTGSADRYAECLTRLMQLTTGTGTSLIPGVYSDKKQIFKRFEEILMNKRKDTRRTSPLKTTGILTAAALLVVVLLQITPVIALPGTHMTYQEMLDHLEQTISNTEQANDLNTVSNSNITPVASVVWEHKNSPATETVVYPKIEAYAWANTIAYATSLKHETDVDFDSDVDVDPDVNFDADPVVDVDPDFGVNPQPADIDGLRDRDGLLSKIINWSNDVTSNFGTGTSITSDDDGVVSVYISDRRYKLKAKFAGDIEFTDNDRAVKSISKDGFIAIYEKDGSDEHEIDIISDKNGELDILYTVDGDEHIFDDAGKEWFANALEILYYQTGLNYKERVERIYTEKGVDAVLDELDKIESGYVIRLYMTALLNHTDLSDDEYGKVIQIAGEKIDSDYEKAELLIGISPSIKHNPDLVENYVLAVGTIESDYETRRVLSEISLDKNTDKKVIEKVLEISGNIDSDYERAELLIDIADVCSDDESLAESYIEAFADIDSDYEKRRVFTALGKRSKLTRESLNELIILAQELDSDYEKAEFLIDLSEMCENNPEAQMQLLKAVSTLDSDYETNRVLSNNNFDCDSQSDLVLAKLELLINISSDYEKVEALVDHAECASHNDIVRAQYLAALRDITSDYEKKRALMELIGESEINDELVIEYITACRLIYSDYDKGVVLKELADYVRGKEDLEELYLDIVDEIGSDYERDQLYNEIDKRRAKAKRASKFD